ncbi:MAG: hypothetical protein AAF696_16685 [Bacteroidota bacterium]
MNLYFILIDLIEADLAEGILEISDFALCYQDGELRTFGSKSDAQTYLQTQKIKGRVIKLKSERIYSLK